MTTYEIKCKADRFTFCTDRIDATSAANAVMKWKRAWLAEQAARQAAGLRSKVVPKNYTVRALGEFRG